MRRRPSSRLLVLDPGSRVLLFRFAFKRGALAGRDYWATPGGALEAGETFSDAARRELFEETGLTLDVVDAPVAEREFVLLMPDGERVLADERYFLVHAVNNALSKDHWTIWETEVMVDHRWWSASDLVSTREVIFPESLIDILASVGAPDGK